MFGTSRTFVGSANWDRRTEPKDAAQARGLLEKRIEDCLTRIIQTKRELNTLTPIAHLPNELLVEIFMWRLLDTAAADREAYMKRDRALPKRKDTSMSISQVSTDFPEKWMREALSRSGEVLLEVLINNQEGTLGRNIIWLALDELPRIKSLTWFRVSDFEKPEDNLPTPTLPFLESLAFYNTTNDLPRGLKLPRLTRLVAHNCSRFTWDHPILVPSLAHLDISGSPNCDLAHILRALRGMPLLQSLRLATVVPHPFAPPAPLCSSQRIALPELRRLILVDDLSQVTSFIYHVSLPVTASLYIKPKTERPSRWFSKYLSPAIRDRYEAVLNTTTCNISHPLQSIHYSNTGYWRAWSEVYPVEYLDEIAARGDCAPALQVSNIRIRVEEVAGDLTVINSICSAFLERHRITSLCLDLGVRSSSLGGWVKLLENLPRLRELAIMRYGVRELVRALSHSTPRATVLRDSEASSSLVVPSLQVLLLEGAVRRVSQGPEDFEFVEGLLALRAMLAEREEKGCMLERLLLRKCTLTEKNIRELQDVVKSVEWDENED